MVHVENVSQVFETSRGRVRALDDISLHVVPGEFVTIRGPSGCGKTTLLLAIGGMLRPTSGKVSVDGRDIYAMSVRDRARFRAATVGFVFQMFHLVPYLTVHDNVVLPAVVGQGKSGQGDGVALLERFGMTHRAHHRPAELSAGERQRVAMARAMLNKPKLIVADEPTGNLDPENAVIVMEGLASFHRAGGTVIVVTHGTSADAHADRVISLRDGKLVDAID